jgi:carbohydrate kinase (thermoresistant glucokinase family)
MIIVIMGVCSCGKTLIGKMVAEQMGLSFYDADDYHAARSVEKMSLGIALDDNDRIPWLQRMAEEMPRWERNGGAVLACSALKEAYRKILESACDVRFVYLKGPKELIIERMRARKDHYMPVSLVDSQFATLEEPAYAVVADATKKPHEIVRYVFTQLNKMAED